MRRAILLTELVNALIKALEQTVRIYEYRACHLCNLGKSRHSVGRNAFHPPRRYALKIDPTHNRYRKVEVCDLSRKGLIGSRIE